MWCWCVILCAYGPPRGKSHVPQVMGGASVGVSACAHLQTLHLLAIISKMSIQRSDVIDGIGLENVGEKVVMLISDHLAWDDPAHVSLLATKIEAYASAMLSGQLADSYPQATGKSTIIRLIYEKLPDAAALCFLSMIEDQLRIAGIGFEHMPLPSNY